MSKPSSSGSPATCAEWAATIDADRDAPWWGASPWTIDTRAVCHPEHIVWRPQHQSSAQWSFQQWRIEPMWWRTSFVVRLRLQRAWLAASSARAPTRAHLSLDAGSAKSKAGHLLAYAVLVGDVWNG
jgi:hypothetical protein